MTKPPFAFTLSVCLFTCATFSGCASANKSSEEEALSPRDEAYVTVQPGVGSRITKRVKASEVHKLREPGQQRAYSEEDMVHLMTPTAVGAPSGRGDGAP